MKSFKQIKTKEWFDYDLKITIKPCFKCNHECWFCSEYDNSTPVWTKEHCDMVVDKLTTIPEDRRKIFIYFYGGEPTLSQHWEYLHERIIDILHDRVLFIQTQTNLSLTKHRLEKFLKNITALKCDHHTIDICSSYHIDKQSVSDFIEKMSVCDDYNCLGLCFYSTEIPKHEKCVEEFNCLLRSYPDKVKLRFTETNNLVNKNVPGYEHLLTDQYLVGNDKGKSLEYRYWLREYPEWRKYFKRGWNFDVDGDVYNFSDVSGKNIHMKFKYMKCECGTKNIVIDHLLNVFHCNDDFYNNINSMKLLDINLPEYISRDVRCMNSACYDGLDFYKTI